MGVTTALSSAGLLQLQTQATQPQAKVKATIKAKRLALRHHYPCHFNIISRSENRGSIVVNSISTSDAGTAMSDVGELKQKYRKWQWKGQYSINYLVSSNSAADSSRPSLLLVHGFGASILHWRR